MALKKSDPYPSLWASCDALRGIAIGLTTLDTAFSDDPLFVMRLFEDISGFRSRITF
jgi:hypothetical protein